MNRSFNEFKDNISALDPKEIYNWPTKYKIMLGCMVFFILSVLGLFFIISDKYDELSDAQNKEETLKQSFIDKNKQAVNLDLYKKQLIDITQASDELLKQLPNKSEVEKLLIYINQAGVSRGLKFELFKPGQEKLYEFYAELPISIKVIGSYEALGDFSDDISQLSRVVLLKDINIINKDGLLAMEATAKTFRYLDQVELDKQKANKKQALEKSKMTNKSENDKNKE